MVHWPRKPVLGDNMKAPYCQPYRFGVSRTFFGTSALLFAILLMWSCGASVAEDCVPQCGPDECGLDDGCGGTCVCPAEPAGGDPEGEDCTPACAGRQCGDDGCGGSCGECGGGVSHCIDGVCSADLPPWLVTGAVESPTDSGGIPEQSGRDSSRLDNCRCFPWCEGKECGDDGCGGSCGDCVGLQEICQAGQCVCVPYCEVNICGSDGCGGLCGLCEEWEECVDGWCEFTGEDGDCRDILLCAVTCPNYLDCIDDCYDQSSINGQGTYDDMVECSDTICAEYENQSAPKQLCLVESCPGPWSDCIEGWGEEDCMFILECLPGCGGDKPCQWECIFSGTEQAQELYWITQTCVATHCGYCGQDQACLDACVPANCLDEVYACENCIPCPYCR